MSILLEYKTSSGFLLVTFNGLWAKNDIEISVKEIGIEAEKQKTKRILLDLRGLSSPPSEMNRFYAGEILASVLGKYKIAGFAQADKINRFAENVAVNRGAHFKMFVTEADSIDWLIDDY